MVSIRLPGGHHVEMAEVPVFRATKGVVETRPINDVTVEDVRRAGAFSLVVRDLPPPQFAEFALDGVNTLRDCKYEGLQQSGSTGAADSPTSRCTGPVHVWHVAHYRVVDGANPAASIDEKWSSTAPRAQAYVLPGTGGRSQRAFR